MRNEIRQQLVTKLVDKEYRDIFVDEQINTGLAFQIRGLREQRGWSQSDLGKRAGMAQSRISVIEDANYSRFSLTTLKRLASAFDVGLTVCFESYSDLVEHFVELDSTVLNMPSFSDDAFITEVPPAQTLGFLNSISTETYVGQHFQDYGRARAISQSYGSIFGNVTNTLQAAVLPSRIIEQPVAPNISNLAQQSLVA
jgi:transcriptional regulator with XRE-family HTH domain